MKSVYGVEIGKKEGNKTKKIRILILVRDVYVSVYAHWITLYKMYFLLQVLSK